MEKKDLRIVFMGTPEFAVESLKSLVEGGYNVVAVVTQPDKPVGRHQDTLQAPPVKQYALEQGLPVLQPVKMKDPEFVEQLRGFRADLQVVVAFRMLPEVVWAMPRFGTFNVHAAFSVALADSADCPSTAISCRVNERWNSIHMPIGIPAYFMSLPPLAFANEFVVSNLL